MPPASTATTCRCLSCRPVLRPGDTTKVSSAVRGALSEPAGPGCVGPEIFFTIPHSVCHIRENSREGYVNTRGALERAVYVREADMNRAIDGDIVAVELYPKDKWRAPSGTLFSKLVVGYCFLSLTFASLSPYLSLSLSLSFSLPLGLVERHDAARLLIEGGKVEEDAVPVAADVQVYPTGRVIGQF